MSGGISWFVNVLVGAAIYFLLLAPRSLRWQLVRPLSRKDRYLAPRA